MSSFAYSSRLATVVALFAFAAPFATAAPAPKQHNVARYGEQFKATAVKLSSLPGVLIQDVAAALDIRPFMLSLWRKQVREGVIVARASKLDVKTT